jgi:hypothetical protein
MTDKTNSGGAGSTSPCSGSAEVLTGAKAHEALDHAMMGILSDVYGAYHLVPESDRNEYEAKYGKPNA